MNDTYILKIFRGDPGYQAWEEFELLLTPYANVISGLMHIQCNPINRQGERVTPVVWESGCLEEVCGSCSMLINGKPRQACTALIQNIIDKTHNHTICLAPLTKFPLIRDLIVDRSKMFDDLKRVRAWIDTDKSHDQGPGVKIDPRKQEMMYALSTCMTCGCCLEACPQVNNHSDFIGPAAISQARLFNAHPVGHDQKALRLRPLMQGGCGNNQNCVQVCPKNIPLTDSIAEINRDMLLQAFQDMFNFTDRK